MPKIALYDAVVGRREPQHGMLGLTLKALRKEHSANKFTTRANEFTTAGGFPTLKNGPPVVNPFAPQRYPSCCIGLQNPPHAAKVHTYTDDRHTALQTR